MISEILDTRTVLSLVILAADAATIARALLRPHREPASRLAWIIAVLALPILGVLLYLLFGETRISGRRRQHGRDVNAKLPRPLGNTDVHDDSIDIVHRPAFALATTVNGLEPTTGNSARLAKDSNAAIDEMVADIDRATQTVHACFYIWLGDTNGQKVKDAMLRAAARGVQVRALADALGSRKFIGSDHWKALLDGGCLVRPALPVGNPLWTLIRGRVDLRNHRKLLVVDNKIAWCGSQNTADPEFEIKPHYAPWVDIMSRWEGPVAVHWQYLFASDWVAEGGDPIDALLRAPLPSAKGEITAQVLGTGPTAEFDAMPACFAELIHSAREELVVTTPYFVPDEQLLFALSSAGRRGVRTLLLLPRRNDNWIVAGACRSYYEDLIKANVEVYEYECGLLHAKTMVVDGCVAMIGSANLDRRSFELNFENNILLSDRSFAAALRARQDEFLKDCRRVTPAQVIEAGVARRLWRNLLATLSPIL